MVHAQKVFEKVRAGTSLTTKEGSTREGARPARRLRPSLPSVGPLVTMFDSSRCVVSATPGSGPTSPCPWRSHTGLSQTTCSLGCPGRREAPLSSPPPPAQSSPPAPPCPTPRPHLRRRGGAAAAGSGASEDGLDDRAAAPLAPHADAVWREPGGDQQLPQLLLRLEEAEAAAAASTLAGGCARRAGVRAAQESGGEEPAAVGPEHPADLRQPLLQVGPRVKRRAGVHSVDGSVSHRQLRDVTAEQLERGGGETLLEGAASRLLEHHLRVVARQRPAAATDPTSQQPAVHQPRSARHVNDDAASLRGVV